MDKVLGSKKNITIFVVPALVIFCIFGLIPILYNIYLSFFRTDLLSPPAFIGVKNYINLFQDNTFLTSLKNNIFMVIGSLLAHLPLAILFATFLFNKVKGSKFFQSVFFLPCVICGVAVGLMWSFIYNSEFGLVNKILQFFHKSNLCRQWLSDNQTVIFAIIIVVMWQYVGYHMVIQLAAMRNIPTSLYEAASIDGASKLRQFTTITLPLIKNILKIDTVLIITGSLKYFDLIFVMTSGGPNHASEVLSTYMYMQGFRNLKFGYASAISTVLFLLCILAMLISNLCFHSEDIEY